MTHESGSISGPFSIGRLCLLSPLLSKFGGERVRVSLVSRTSVGRHRMVSQSMIAARLAVSKTSVGDPRRQAAAQRSSAAPHPSSASPAEDRQLSVQCSRQRSGARFPLKRTVRMRPGECRPLLPSPGPIGRLVRRTSRGVGGSPRRTSLGGAEARPPPSQAGAPRPCRGRAGHARRGPSRPPAA